MEDITKIIETKIVDSEVPLNKDIKDVVINYADGTKRVVKKGVVYEVEFSFNEKSEIADVSVVPISFNINSGFIEYYSALSCVADCATKRRETFKENLLKIVD